MKATSFVICNELAIGTRIYIVIVMKVSAAEQARPLTLQQDSLERLSKLCVEDAVDNGIESGV